MPLGSFLVILYSAHNHKFHFSDLSIFVIWHATPFCLWIFILWRSFCCFWTLAGTMQLRIGGMQHFSFWHWSIAMSIRISLNRNVCSFVYIYSLGVSKTYCNVILYIADMWFGRAIDHESNKPFFSKFLWVYVLS